MELDQLTLQFTFIYSKGLAPANEDLVYFIELIKIMATVC